MKILSLVGMLFCFSGTLFAEDDPCLPLVNEELARLGYGSLNPSNGCIDKKVETGQFGYVRLSNTPLKHPQNAVYAPNAKRLSISLGDDEITGDSMHYDIYFTNDCKGISTISYYGNLGPGISINATRQKCKDAVAGKFKSEDYAEKQWNEKLIRICKAYELKLIANPTDGATGSIKNKKDKKDRAI